MAHDIVFKEEWVEEIIRDEVEKQIRSKVRKMMNGYGSHEYLERVISRNVWEIMMKEEPCVEFALQDTLKQVRDEYKERILEVSISDILKLGR